jgi:MFS family permease
MLGVLAAYGIGLSGANTMPLLLGALMDALALDSQSGGFLGTLELVAGALGSLVLAPRAATVPRRRLALVGGALAVSGYFLSAAVSGYTAIALVRVATGVCCGVVLAAGNAAAAASKDPDRLFALVAFLAGVAATVLLWTLPYAVVPWGYAGGFALLGIVCLVALPLFWWLPAAPGVPEQGEFPTRGFTGAVAATLAGVFMLEMCGQGVWAFTERIGVGVGLDLADIGKVAALGNFSGLLGSVVAAWLGTRRGRTAPLAFGVGTTALAQWFLVNASSGTTYAVAQVGWGLAFYFTAPYMLGLAASLDRQGRWTVSAGAMMMLGAAMGPLMAGSAIESWGYAGFARLLMACTAVAFASFTLVSAKLARESETRLGESDA